MCVYIYIYIYTMYRERERERDTHILHATSRRAMSRRITVRSACFGTHRNIPVTCHSN